MIMADTVTINRETCTSCGMCAAVCPIPIIYNAPEAGIVLREDRMPLCIGCGQCMAACPTQSVSVDGLDYARDFFDLAEGAAGEMPFLEMIQSRRAVRAFKDKPVPRELLEEVAAAIALAPPGFTPIKTEVTVIQDPEVMRKALPEMIDLYDGLLRAMNHPVSRIVVRRKVGAARYRTLLHHVIPLMESRIEALKDGTEDTITRGAPAMIVFHADRRAENSETDIAIALTYGFLTAHALGLGATPIDLVPPVVEQSAMLRELLAIPEGNVVAGALILGYPRVRYQRGIKRSLKRVSWV
jgi:nitroreductase/NAD-dependent dihydropyrimidine dehydrogenase PreA subunit